MHIEGDLKLFVQKIKEIFPERISGILQYGSTLDNDDSIDIDIMIVLNTKETPEDILNVKEVVRFFSSKVDLQVICSKDIASGYFSHGTHGEFFIRFMKSAKVLYGKNEFLQHKVFYTKQVASIVRKIRYYYQSAKSDLIHSKINEAKYRQLKKRALMMLVDFYLAYSGEIIKRNNISKINDTSKILGMSENQISLLGLQKWEDNLIASRDIIELYQDMYNKSLSILEPKIQRGEEYIKGIHVSEYKVGGQELVIIVPGLPHIYEETEIPLFFNIHGYDVINFSYKGSVLSEQSKILAPEKDLETLLDFYKEKYKKIIIVACSFGGYVALNATYPEDVVNKIFIVSGVVNFPSVKGIETLPKYLALENPFIYSWDEKMIEQYIQKSTYPKILAQNVYFFHGIKDEQISCSEVYKFAKENGYSFTEIDEGHISLRNFCAGYVNEFYKIINN